MHYAYLYLLLPDWLEGMNCSSNTIFTNDSHIDLRVCLIFHLDQEFQVNLETQNHQHLRNLLWGLLDLGDPGI